MKKIRSTMLCVLVMLLFMGIAPLSALAFDDPKWDSGWYWPVPNSLTMSEGFSNDHQELDIISTRGVNEPIVAARAGTVVAVYEGCGVWNGYELSHSACNPVVHRGYDDLPGIKWPQSNGNKVCNYGYGNGVVIDHGGPAGQHVYSWYLHMATVDVTAGQTVSAGTKIGTMGSSGYSSGRHLEFAIAEYAYLNDGMLVGDEVNTNPYGSEYVINGSWNQVDNIQYIRNSALADKVKLDINSTLDGTYWGKLENHGTCDIYIDGTLVANDVNDFYEDCPLGATYKVTDIKAASGHGYVGQKEFTGIIRDEVSLILPFVTTSTSGFDNSGWYWPVPDSLYMSRGYGSGHEALDIISTRGVNETVVAARAGTVIAVYEGCSKWDGYGQSHASCNPVAHLPSGDKWGIKYYQSSGGTEVCNYGIGNGVVIDHGNGVYSEYSHMASVNVSVGQWVNGAATIGTMGSYGNSTGRHLHFAIKTGAYLSSGGYPNGTGMNNNAYGSEYIINGSWNGVDNIYYSREYPWLVKNVTLHVNGIIDGVASGTLDGFGTCDIYINGVLDGNDWGDYYTSWPEGTTYKVTDIKAKPGYRYVGPAEYTGTLGSSDTIIELPFLSQGTLHVNGSVDGVASGTLDGFGTCDVYINGVLDGDDWGDYYTSWPVGTTYKVTDIKAKDGYTYVGQAEYTGTIGSSDVIIELPFHAHGTLELSGVLDSETCDDIAGLGVCDVYVNGTLAAEGVSDFSAKYPQGTEYEIRNIVAVDGVYYVGPETISGTIGKGTNTVQLVFSTTPVSGGVWQEVSELPSYVNADDYEIQYKHSYKTSAATAPGADWIQGESSVEYTPAGESSSFYNVNETDTHRLLYYYYYHFCGPNAGDVANYDMRGNFVHYDGVDPSTVWVELQVSDDDDPNIPAYILRWNSSGEQAWCHSGTTCDGSHGTHGARSKAWYRMNVYQDYTKTTIYEWTKADSEWMNTLDSTAASVSYRFRLKDTAAPVIDSVAVTAVTQNGFTLLCKVSDNVAPANVRFGTWKNSESSSDAKWQTVEAADFAATEEENVFEATVTVSIADFGSERDCFYNTVVYAADMSGNEAQYEGEIQVFVPTVVHAELKITLPADLKTVEEGAFEGDAKIGEVIVPEGVETIGSRAFADCFELALVQLPESVAEIAVDAFEESGNVVLYCPAGSTAEQLAQANGWHYVTGD